MKKITLLMATLFMVSMMITGCDRDDPTPTPTPDPTPDTYTVVYMINDQANGSTMSPCFKMNVTYTDADGQLVTENNVTLPWTKSVDVEIPFHAKMTVRLHTMKRIFLKLWFMDWFVESVFIPMVLEILK